MYGDATAATRTRRRRLESRVHGAFAFLSFSSSESPFSAPAKFKEPLLSSRERRKERVRPNVGTRLSDERSAISIRSSGMGTSIGTSKGTADTSLASANSQLIRQESAEWRKRTI